LDEGACQCKKRIASGKIALKTIKEITQLAKYQVRNFFLKLFQIPLVELIYHMQHLWFQSVADLNYNFSGHASIIRLCDGACNRRHRICVATEQGGIANHTFKISGLKKCDDRFWDRAWAGGIPFLGWADFLKRAL
jgi:hypothetical protein